MFKRILVPLDGSTRAEHALPVAARIASASGGSLILLQVVMSPSIEFWPALGAVPPPSITQTIVNADIAESEKYLSQLSASHNLEGIATETVTLFGSIAPTILSVAQSYKADLIVMHSHGYTGMTRWVMGSIAEKIARHAPIPALILREGSSSLIAHPDIPRMPRVLVPLDGSAYAKSALIPAAYLSAALAYPHQGALHLTRVVNATVAQHLEQLQPGEKERMLDKAKKYLSATVEHIREGHVAPDIAKLTLTITWSVTVDTDTAEAIMRVAENGEDVDGVNAAGRCDVIAIATHGYGGLQRWALGSITERILNTTRLPVLVVRPTEMINRSEPTWNKAALTTVVH